MKQNNNPPLEEQINFIDLALQIKESKNLIFWTTLIFTLSALIYAIQKPDLYKTTILLTPTTLQYPSGVEEPIHPIKETLSNIKVQQIYEEFNKQRELISLTFSIFENQLIKVVCTSESKNENLFRLNEYIEDLASNDNIKANMHIQKMQKEYTRMIASLEREINFITTIESQKLTDLRKQFQLLETQQNEDLSIQTRVSTLRQINEHQSSTRVFKLTEEQKALEFEMQDLNEINIILAKIDLESTQTISTKIALITALGFFGGLFTSLILMLFNKLSLSLRSQKL